MKRFIKTIIEFVINWFWVGTLEKIYWSLFITELVWVMNWSFGKVFISEETLETIFFKTLDYLGWVAIININLFIISGIIKWISGHFRVIPDKITFE